MMARGIDDEFARLSLSRQRRYQLRRMARGLCEKCGDVALLGMVHCERCRNAVRVSARRRTGAVKVYTNTKFARATKNDPLTRSTKG